METVAAPHFMKHLVPFCFMRSKGTFCGVSFTGVAHPSCKAARDIMLWLECSDRIGIFCVSGIQEVGKAPM